MTKKVGKSKVAGSQLSPNWIKGLVGLKKSWVGQAQLTPPKKNQDWARVWVLQKTKPASFSKALADQLSAWDLKELAKSQAPIQRYSTAQGPLWLVRIPDATKTKPNHQGLLEPTSYSQARDLGGVLVQLLADDHIHGLHLHFHDWNEDLVSGLLVGLEMATYKFQQVVNGSWPPAAQLAVTRQKGKVPTKLVENAGHLGAAMNISRHLVNLPANWLNPQSYAQAMTELFKGNKEMKVTVWEGDKLVKEKMGLLQAVGAGAEYGPRLVHLCYRPTGKGKTGKPFAFVGKGVTFDSGGLNLKPPSPMRLMKKDMGGSATVAGLAAWVAGTKSGKACDFYLSLAENAVSGASFRPGDVLRARNGLLVEIHNTDAEGRLVLGDALDVAANPPKGETPRVIVDISTLTGAIKAGLGLDVGGFFANQDGLAEELQRASQQSGDLLWRMPLYQPYHRKLATVFADKANCTDGFGGAVTAALFLECFVGDIPWAHLDIYSWMDRPEGPYTEAGGSGQAVQCLAEWLS